MSNVRDGAPFSKPDERPAVLGRWLANELDRRHRPPADLAAAVGVEPDLVEQWLAGRGPVTLEQATAVDAFFNLSAGSTAAAGGYVSFQAVPDLAGETVFSTRWHSNEEDVLADLDAAFALGLGVRMRNEVHVDEVDDRGGFTGTEWWVLELLGAAPIVDDPDQ